MSKLKGVICNLANNLKMKIVPRSKFAIKSTPTNQTTPKTHLSFKISMWSTPIKLNWLFKNQILHCPQLDFNTKHFIIGKNNFIKKDYFNFNNMHQTKLRDTWSFFELNVRINPIEHFKKSNSYMIKSLHNSNWSQSFFNLKKKSFQFFRLVPSKLLILIFFTFENKVILVDLIVNSADWTEGLHRIINWS